MPKIKEELKSNTGAKAVQMKPSAEAGVVKVPVANECNPKNKVEKPSIEKPDRGRVNGLSNGQASGQYNGPGTGASKGKFKYTDKERERFRGPNYQKYLAVREQLVKSLDGTRTAREIREEVKISQLTFFKYKALAQLDSGQRLMTLEEKIHLNKNAQAGNHYDRSRN